MNKEKALKNQGLEFREDMKKDGGKFDAILRLENGKIAFAFPPRNQ